MLHHGHITVAGGLHELSLAFFDVGKCHLLVLLLLGEHGRAGEGGIEGCGIGGLVAITHQLQIELRAHRLAAVVHHLVPHTDQVAAALHGVGFHQLHATDLGRLEAHLHLVLAIGQGRVGPRPASWASCGWGSCHRSDRSGRCRRARPRLSSSVNGGCSWFLRPPMSCACLSNRAPISEPPSLLKVSCKTSVVMVCRTWAALLAPSGGVPAAFDVPAPGKAAGRLVLLAPAAGGAPSAGLGAVTAEEGKKVGALPLWICHLSQIRTMEKPNTTHRMDRRMSFMTGASFQRKGKPDEKTGQEAQRAQDRDHQRTKAHSGPDA